jgi:hypothetical protein
MGKVHGSCGCELDDLESGVEVRFGEWGCNDRGFYPVVSSGFYCGPCSARLEEFSIKSDHEAEEWLDQLNQMK